MRALVLYAHPNPQSYGAALHRAVLEALQAAGHDIDDCDLYGEGFDPVLSLNEREIYHAVPANTVPVADHVARLRRAQMLVIVAPVWNFGWPAILKGYLDRVFLPGVSFVIKDGRVAGSLSHIRKLVVVTTYGASRWRAMLMGDPPRKIVTRMLRGVIGFRAQISYLAHYDMNRSTQGTLTAFLDRVQAKLRILS
jgi:NAD(P)H dehydrogenase (quinone)